MKIEDIDILEKIIEFQSLIIVGRELKTILRLNRKFYLNKSKADAIVIYMHEHKKVHIEYIFEEHRFLTKLLKKYILDKKEFKWNKFTESCNRYFTFGLNYQKSSNIYDIFKGFLSKRESDLFSEELKIKNIVFMPIHAYNDREKIGYVSFLFKSEVDLDINMLEMIKESFQIMLQPLYDKEYHTMYTRCVRIDEHMSILTVQEKKIVSKILEGVTYTEIANFLGISINTLKTHMKNIFNKYNVNSKIELYNKFNVHA